MQVVIDITEKMYEDCKVRNTLHYSPYDFSSMIVNGTILPKGHGRLIDADNISFSQFFDAGDYSQAKRGIYNAPTIVEADMRGGE